MSTLLKKKSAKATAKAKKKKPAAKKESQEKFSLKRLVFGEEKPDLSELESGSTTVLDIPSPTAVDTKSRDYIVVDGVYHAYLYVTDYGYATTVGSCWLALLVEAGKGVKGILDSSRIKLVMQMEEQEARLIQGVAKPLRG